MPALKKVMEQRQAAGAKAAQVKKTPKKRNSSLSDQYKHDNYNTNKSQNSQSNDEADPNEMEDLNIG